MNLALMTLAGTVGLLLILLVLERADHRRQEKLWRGERTSLLNRVLGKNLADLFQAKGQPPPKPPRPMPGYSDAQEAQIERMAHQRHLVLDGNERP